MNVSVQRVCADAESLNVSPFTGDGENDLPWEEARLQRSEPRFQHKTARDHYIPAEKQGPEPME